MQTRWQGLRFHYLNGYYHYFNEWSTDGTLEQIHTVLRKKLRQKQGKKPDPTVAVIDSQTVKSTHIPAIYGYDAGKLIKGIKRTIAVETLGLPLIVFVHPADIQDRDSAKPVFKKLNRFFRRLKKVFADRAYQGSLVEWVNQYYSWALEIVKRIGKGFVVEPKRWIVERTYSWFEKARRLSKNYEATARNAEGMIYVTMIHLMTKRLAKNV
jgi:putative transposase